MTEETPNETANGHDLRTITPRLEDLKRKCRSVGSRNQEAMEMEERLESILTRLRSQDDPDADPVNFTGLARELYAVERFFESNGFISVAKEVAHVERSLEAMASADEADPTGVPVLELEKVPDASSPDMDEEDETEDMDAPRTWAVPKPLAAVMALFVTAIAVCVFIIIRHQNPPDVTVAQRVLRPIPTPATATPIPTPRPDPSTMAPLPGAVLAESVGKARLSLAAGDIEGTMDHLSRAALVDSDHATVLGVAGQLIGLLIEHADAAVEGGLWEIADLTLARADRIATRFGLDAQGIRDAEHRHAQMERFTLVEPGDSEAIRAQTGKRVTVFLENGKTQESIINGVKDNNLLLDEDTTVRGGAMYYVQKIPLKDIDYLKVWDD